LGDGAERFLPVEHMDPRTEATTQAIRERVGQASVKGRLRVRDLGGGSVSMLSSTAAASRAQEIRARRVRMDEGIAVLRDNYNSKKWLSGRISAIQSNGVYVGVVEGQDALIPVAEIPDSLKLRGEDGDDGGDKEGFRTSLRAGQQVEFRIVRYSWQSDSFAASMLSYEESVARNRAMRGGDGPMSAPAAAEPLAAPAFSTGRLEGSSKRWADMGFSVVDGDIAKELNEWLRGSNAEEDKKTKGKKPVAKAAESERKFIVNFARGMNPKPVGQISVGMKATDKEIKDAAVALVTAEGELKAGQSHKGVIIAKNIITVKA